jgi:hypothetical protein
MSHQSDKTVNIVTKLSKTHGEDLLLLHIYATYCT